MAKGAPIVLVGSVLNVVLVFVFTVLVARYIGRSEFGLFMLCAAIVKSLSFLAGLGFQRGIPRYISYQLGKNEYRKAWSSVVSSSIIVSLASLFLAFLLFLNAGFISELLHKPGLEETIKIMALALPFMALLGLVVSYLQGLHIAGGRVYFQHILRPFIGIMLMLLVMTCKLSYAWAVWAYSISFCVTSLALLFYATRRIPRLLPRVPYLGVTREIVRFSLPLLGSGILAQLLLIIDTIFLGYFESAESVAYYSSALRVALLLPIISTSVAFVFLPMASGLFSQNKHGEIKQTYVAITKWAFIVTLPLFLYIFFAPDLVLGLSFGAKYSTTTLPLQVLSLGYFMHVLFGLNLIICISHGRLRMVLVAQVIGLASNAILDIFLIPEYGALGASVATLFSITFVNASVTAYVYRHLRIHPFSKGYLKMILFAIGISVIFFLVPIRSYLNHSITLVPFFLGVSLIGVFATKCLTREDAYIIGRIEKKFTNSTRFSDRFAGFFISH